MLKLIIHTEILNIIHYLAAVMRIWKLIRLFGDIDDDEFFDHEKIYEKILNLVKHSSSVLK